MLFYSTNHISPAVDFKQACLAGQPGDKGLYFPQEIPVFPAGMMATIETCSNEAIAYEVIRPYTGDTIAEGQLKKIVEETVNFPIPLVPVSDKIFSLELFHGPTLAFKDIGARFMSRCLSHFVKTESRKVLVLVATSGDTGSAVANGFYDLPNLEVIILYPSGKVSKVQEKQLTTQGKNITALEVNGSFDDCQQMVKHAFANAHQFPHLFLTSANSINIARWLPQQFYYFFAWKQWADKKQPPVISVPSGNFGNTCAGLLAQASGLPVKHFIAACNVNDIIPEYLRTGEYKPKPSIASISNAMDVGDPSNFVRILELFKDPEILKAHLSAYSISDEMTRDTILTVYNHTGYLLDPHAAVGYSALEIYLQDHPAEKGIVLETAHPLKFYDVVEPVIQASIPIPDQVRAQMNRNKRSILMEKDATALVDFLKKR